MRAPPAEYNSARPVCRVQLGALIFYAAGEISAAYGAISFWTF